MLTRETHEGTPRPQATDNRFANLTYDDFRRMAADSSLSRHEKIGFPNEYRQGKEEAIFADILGKVSALGSREKTVLDIGPGCGGLAHLIVEHCQRQGHRLILIDSREMLDQLPDRPGITKLPGCFPRCEEVIGEYAGQVDAIICYSVAQYVFVETSLFEFVDQALLLLAPGGALLVGDIPNVSKRKRFFASPAGRRFHQQFVGRAEEPPDWLKGAFNQPEPGKIDDAVLLGLLMRARAAGYDSYIVKQNPDLPMANRREDLLICKP
jgi:hypothetical protein